MYSEKLERLIQLSIEDGEVDDASWAILLKKVNEEGVDPDELTLYVNSLLKKQNRAKSTEMTEKVQVYEKAKKEAIGNICPKCGKQIPPMSIKCPYCGIELVKTKSNESINLLLKKIDDINRNYDSQIAKSDSAFGATSLFGLGDDKVQVIEDRERQIIDAITLFPVPNTKEDIIEFLSTAVSQATVNVPFLSTKTGRITTKVVITILLIISLIGIMAIMMLAMSGYYSLAKIRVSDSVIKEERRNAWRAKCNQIIMKGRNIKGDSEFQKQLDYYENILKNK